MPESSKNSYAPIAISILIATISWLLTTTWSEYASRQIITYNQSHKDGLTTFRIRNESFLNNSPELNVMFTCPDSSACFQQQFAEAQKNSGYVGFKTYSPLASGTVSDRASAARVANIELSAMLPRTTIGLTLKPATDENDKPREALIYFQPNTSSTQSVLIIQAGVLTWMLGNFLWILLAIGTVSCLLLGIILSPSIRDSFTRPDKPDTGDAASEKGDG